MAEIRLDIDGDDLQIMDGFCNATGETRTSIVRGLIAKWSRDQLHIATIVCRMARVNPLATESHRQAGSTLNSDQWK